MTNAAHPQLNVSHISLLYANLRPIRSLFSVKNESLGFCYYSDLTIVFVKLKLRLTVLQTIMNSQLVQKVTEFAENDDVSGLTDLLSNWPEHDTKWLLYIDARIVAPSSPAEQTQRSKAIRKNALKLNPPLEEPLYSELSVEDRVAEQDEEAQELKETATAPSADNFLYSDEAQAHFQIIQTIEASEDWQIDEIDVFLNSLDYLQLNEAVQHVVNQTVYGLLRFAEEAGSAQKIAESSVYQA